MLIEDGRTRVTARVSDSGHLYTLSSMRKLAAEAAESGNAFVIESGFITLTAGSEKGVLKVHTHPEETHIHSIRLSSDAAVRWKIFSKATSDTFTVAGTSANTNLGSGTTYSSHVYVGDNTAAVTGGILLMSGFSNANKDLLIESEGILISTASNTIYIVAEGSAVVHAQIILFTHDTSDH